ncbi:MAG: DUF4845 domain-containing protein [Steroidobacteraceae bacterium]
MHRRQKGVTFLGWLVLLTPLALVGYMAIRATPVYLGYSKVVRALEQVRQEYESTEGLTREMIAGSIQKRFDVDYVDDLTAKDMTITKTGDGWVVESNYEKVVPLFYNISLLLQFEKSVTIR